MPQKHREIWVHTILNGCHSKWVSSSWSLLWKNWDSDHKMTSAGEWQNQRSNSRHLTCRLYVFPATLSGKNTKARMVAESSGLGGVWAWEFLSSVTLRLSDELLKIGSCFKILILFRDIHRDLWQSLGELFLQCRFWDRTGAYRSGFLELKFVEWYFIKYSAVMHGS